MPSSNNSFSHVTVDSLATPESGAGYEPDEELVEVGYKGKPAASSHDMPGASDLDEADEDVFEEEDEQEDEAFEPEQEPGSSDDGKRADDAPDYSVDDVEPMELKQKIVLVCVGVLLVILVIYILKYYALI